MKKILILSAIAMASSMAFAQVNQNTTCDVGVTTCNPSPQHMGDVSTIANSGDTHSNVTQLGNSTASTSSGNTISPTNKADAQQTITGNLSGTITGGNTGPSTSAATGGAATGNLSHNDNKSSVGDLSTGASTSNSGGNILGANSGGNVLGGATSGGNVLSNGSSSGGNTLSNGSSVKDAGNSSINGNTLKGGEGGAGGAGGASVAGASSNGTNLGINGQQQGISDSGNSKNTNTNGQGQGQGQQQANSSKNEVKGEQKQSTDASTRSGSDNTIGLNVDASDRSSTSFTDNSRTIFIPPVVPPTPASTLAVGNIVKETTACGPLQTVVKTPIEGKFFGFFGTSNVEQGFTYDLAPATDAQGRVMTYSELPLADGSGYRLIGHQAIILGAIVGTSGARNIAIGGGSSQGSWGQGGGGASSGTQQLVTNIQLRTCDVGTMKYERVAAVKVTPLPVIDKAPE